MKHRITRLSATIALAFAANAHAGNIHCDYNGGAHSVECNAVMGTFVPVTVPLKIQHPKPEAAPAGVLPARSDDKKARATGGTDDPILGLDSAGRGFRDDVLKAIMKRFPHNKKERDEAMAVARVYQRWLSPDVQFSDDTSDAFVRGVQTVQCLDYKYTGQALDSGESSNELSSVSRFIYLATINSDARRKALSAVSYPGRPGGNVTPSPRASECPALLKSAGTKAA